MVCRDRLAALLVLLEEIFLGRAKDHVAAAGGTLDGHHLAVDIDCIGRHQSSYRPLECLADGVSLEKLAIPPSEGLCRLYSRLPVGQGRSALHPPQDIEHLAGPFVKLHQVGDVIGHQRDVRS